MKNYCLLLFLIIALPLSAQVVLIDGVPRDTSYTIYSSYIKEKKKRPYIEIVKPVFEGLYAEEKVVYKKTGEGRNLHLNVYRPDNEAEYPALLMVHGGGWNSGDLSMQTPLATHIAREGFVCIPVEYRLIPEALYPAGVQDVEDAVKWVYANAGKLGIDKNRIVISGCSAGGQLACLVGTANKDSYIRAVVNIDGISTFLNEATIERAERARLEKTKMPVDATWLGGTYSENPCNWEDASALSHVSGNSVPVCFINSSIPRFHNGRDELVQKLDSMGIYSETHEIDDSPHTFWFFNPWFDATVNYVVSFLNKIQL
ncbi:alpha/beta hydrolase [Paludibacter sp. 221]|uniref:alpha/beta hydrolase n=1 Tax=Paludibacter sp. 221 TaxID=2302939 RepID=UPI0013D16DFE|nr:alpha/beta hydrolase [Paludibacter sp. 221]NDV45582.1 alpha/beta hydrolase [Paludibacter sp. 221]